MFFKQTVKIAVVTRSATLWGVILGGLVGYALARLGDGLGAFLAIFLLCFVGGALLGPLFSFSRLVATYSRARLATTVYAVALLLSTPLWIIKTATVLLRVLGTRTLTEALSLVQQAGLVNFLLFIPAGLAVLIAGYYRRAGVVPAPPSGAARGLLRSRSYQAVSEGKGWLLQEGRRAKMALFGTS